MNLNEIIKKESVETQENLEANVETNVEANGNLDEVNEETESTQETEEDNVETNSDLDGFVDINDPEVPEVPEAQPTIVEAAPKLNFSDRAELMGLNILPGGTYHYVDQFSEVVYKNIKTLEGSGIVDDTELSHLAIYTKSIEEDSEWKFQNFISDAYKFLGNETLINQIKESITSIGNAALDERTFMTSNLMEIRHEIIIRHANAIPAVGTIYPMMNITNTYNGTGASRIVFGMNIAETGGTISSFCTEKFGKIKQIHIAGASTELSSAFGEYVTIFGNNITNLIAENFTNNITESDMLKVLDIIETKLGKKRRELISNELIIDAEESSATPVPWNMTSWQLFLALTRFTSVETNLNAKRILENVIERVLIVPAQMMESLKVING